MPAPTTGPATGRDPAPFGNWLLRVMSPVARFMSDAGRASRAIMAVPFVAFGLFIIVQLTSTFWLAWRSTWWPQTAGMVTVHEVSTTGEPRPSVHRRLRYNFTAEGAAWTAERLRVGMGAPGGESSQALVKRLPVGCRVAVSYAPGRPSLAVLEPGVKFRDVACAVGFLGMWFGR